MNSSSLPVGLRLYGMQERADHLDFDIRFEGARDVLARPHRHEYFQIQVSIEGGSEQLIGGARRPFTAGHMSFVLPFKVHVVPHPPGARYAIVNFAQRFLWPELPLGEGAALEDVPLQHLPELAPFVLQERLDFHFDAADFARILAWLEELRALNEARRLGSVGAIRGILLQLLGLTCRRHEAALLALLQQQPAAGAPPRNDALQRVLRYLREHLQEEITLHDAAAAAMLSPNYLAHLLKQQTARTFTELLTERRLEHAKQLLLGSNQRIADIAQLSGFSDAAYFARRFRRWTGMTPRQFRAGAAAPR